MTNSELVTITARFKNVLGVKDEVVKQQRLTNLMNDMEQIFNIPALNNPTFNQANPEIMILYRMVAKERNI